MEKIIQNKYSNICMCAQSLSHIQLFVTPRIIAYQALLSIGFPRQENWSGLPFLLQRTFPSQGSNPHLLHWQANSLPLSHKGSPFPCLVICYCRDNINCIFKIITKVLISKHPSLEVPKITYSCFH